LAKEKKWQCPQCPRDPARRENIVVHIKRKHGGVGDPVEKEKMSQYGNSYPSGNGGPTQNVKPPSSYNRSNHLYTNHANKDSKGHEDIIDKWHQWVLELEEKERKIRKIKEFYCRNPDAPMPMPNVASGNLPIKNMLEQCLPKISFQSGASNNNNNNPSPKMQDNDDDRNKIASQETAGNDPQAPFPRNNRQNHPQSIQPVLTNHDDKDYDRNKIANRKTAVQGIQSRQDPNGQAKQPLVRTGLAGRSGENRERKDLPKSSYWVVKRNLIGDWYDFYRVVNDPIQDLIETHELNWKKGS
jgi:hypothetical protein